MRMISVGMLVILAATGGWCAGEEAALGLARTSATEQDMWYQEPCNAGYCWTETEFTLDSSYVTKYVWYGRTIVDDSCYQPSANLFMPQLGLGLNVWGSFAMQNRDQYRDLDELDYTVYYEKTVCDTVDFRFAYIYYDLPRLSSVGADVQEFQASVALGGDCFLHPYYTFHGMLGVGTSASDGGNGIEDGTLHEFGVTADLDLPFPVAEGCPFIQPLSCSVYTVYDDGWNVSTDGTQVNSDWGYTVGKLSTTFNLGDYWSVTPGVSYQWTHNEEINPDNEWWFSLGISYTLPCFRTACGK